MSVRITCPSCDARLKFADEKRGRRVRCPECDERISVPDDEDDDLDDLPRRRRKPAAKSGISMLWILFAGAAVVLLLLLTIVGVATYFILHRGAQAVENFNAPLPLDLNVGRTVLNTNSRLMLTDPPDPTVPGGRVHMKAFPVQLKAGKTYIIAMNTAAFDPYLRLESPQGKTIAEDDDAGGGLNARITITATQAGQHRIIATSFGDGATGPFQLIVQELP